MCVQASIFSEILSSVFSSLMSKESSLSPKISRWGIWEPDVLLKLTLGQARAQAAEKEAALWWDSLVRRKDVTVTGGRADHSRNDRCPNCCKPDTAAHVLPGTEVSFTRVDAPSVPGACVVLSTQRARPGDHCNGTGRKRELWLNLWKTRRKKLLWNVFKLLDRTLGWRKQKFIWLVSSNSYYILEAHN